MQFRNLLAHVAVGGYGLDLKLWMFGNQTQQLSADIPTGSGDRNGVNHGCSSC